MELTSAKQGAVTVLSLEGQLINSRDANLIRAELKNVLDQRDPRVVLDLKELKWLNSSGLGVLIEGAIKLRKSNGELKLAAPNTTVVNLLRSTRLYDVFESYASTEEAVASFNQ